MVRAFSWPDRPNVRCALELVARAFPDAATELTVDWEDVESDFKTIVESISLETVRRYAGQVYWERESAIERLGDEASGLRLENVAAHSWHVADIVLLLGSHFDVDQDRAIRLALLHDKLEIYTGDYDPVGFDGTGSQSHAFNEDRRAEKERAELIALERYLTMLRPSVRKQQEALIRDTVVPVTPEARFVKAVDKLQALIFTTLKKDGNISLDHLRFSVRYSGICLRYFPALIGHYVRAVVGLIETAASKQSTDFDLLTERIL